jgi:hypothetical protein
MCVYGEEGDLAGQDVFDDFGVGMGLGIHVGYDWDARCDNPGRSQSLSAKYTPRFSFSGMQRGRNFCVKFPSASLQICSRLIKH